MSKFEAINSPIISVMNKKILFTGIILLSLGVFYTVFTKENTTINTIAQHDQFLKEHPFNSSLALTKKERKSKGITPNKYYEEQYLLEIDPATGTTHPENVFALQKALQEARASQRVPGDASDNAWEERGPNNVGGRTRGMMFDPNDTSNETVFAGGVSGGLWKNTNISSSAQTWERVGIPENLAVSCITYDPNNTSIFYVGTGESYVGGDVNGDGVWQSTDGGATWAHIFGGVTRESYFAAASSITVSAPASIADNYQSIATTAFGPEITSQITANIVLVDDSSVNSSQGCGTLTNGSQLNGNIALIRRGSCNFTVKVKNAQNQGAVGAIVMNNISGEPVPMGGTDASVTIPSVMISKADGDLIEAAIASGGTISGSLNVATGDFTALVIPGTQHINDIKVRNNAGVSEVYVAAGDARYGSSNAATTLGGPSFGLYKSIDAGALWEEIDLPLTEDNHKHAPNDIEIGADNKIWIATKRSSLYYDGGGMIFSSTDGATFTEAHQIANGSRTQIAVSATNANTIYVLAELTEGGSVTVLKTTNAFGSVTTLALPNDGDTGIDASDFTRGQAFYDLMLEVDPSNDNIVYTGGIDLFKSTNGGTSWNQFSHWYGGFGYQEVHSDQHILAFANGSSNKLILGNDGGVYYSSNGGTITSARNKGFNVTQFYTVGVAPTTAFTGDYFVAGAQDNGTQLFQNAPAGISSSIEAYGGDGAYSFFDQDGTDRYFIRNYVYNSGITLYNYATSSSVTVSNESASNGSFINPCALDSNLNILYTNYSTSGLYKIKRYSNLLGSITRTELTDDLLTTIPTAFTVDPYTSSTSTVLVGTILGDLLKIENAESSNPTWTEISGPSFVGSVSDVEYGSTNNDIFVTMHNYSVESIWYSNDGGASWAAKEGDLPDIPVKTILQNPLRTDEVIVGTELGVWSTADFSNASPTWVQAYNGMSNVKVTDLDMRDDNAVFAATYGRGIFSGQFTSEPLSIEDVFSDKKVFTIYPTVSTGDFTVFAKNTLGESHMTIFDMNGKQVYSQQIDFATNERNAVSVNLTAGVYLVNLVDANHKKSTSKLVIK